MERLDRHGLAIGEPKALDRDDRLGRGDVQQTAEMRAGGAMRSSSVRLAGTIPRRCMSSVKDVIVSSCAIFGSLTNVPLPWRRTRMPFADEVVERGADGQPGDAEVAAQLPLRGDRLADARAAR